MKEMNKLSLPKRKISAADDMPRNRALPTRSDVLYIKKNFGNIPFHVMKKELNITDAKLLTWSRLILSPSDRNKRWERMIKNLELMEAHMNFEASIMNEEILQLSWPKKKLTNKTTELRRPTYLCTIDHRYNYIVQFDSAIDYNMIQYNNKQLMGCDYEVSPVGQWEYLQLRDEIPVYWIKADEDYIGKFWLTMSKIIANEARRK